MQVAEKGTINATHIQQFQQILGAQYVLFDEESLKHYGHDETELLLFLPEVVLKAPELVSAAAPCPTWAVYC